MEVINPGVRQCDAVGEIQKSLFYGTEEFGGEYSSIATLLTNWKRNFSFTFNSFTKINL